VKAVSIMALPNSWKRNISLRVSDPGGTILETDPFRIRGHVADFDAVVADIVAASARTRDLVPMLADVAYGDGPSEALDIFFPKGPRDNLPVHMFIHGGYWRMWSKREYSCVANTVTQAGAIAVIVDYSLMPTVRMEVIIDQVRRAKLWVMEHITEHGGDPNSLTVSGHSAGGHLSTFLFHANSTTPSVKGALLLGGIYDLAPLQNSFLKDEIALTNEEVAAFSPISQIHNPGCHVTVCVGENETAPFHSQAETFVDVLKRQTVMSSLKVMKGRDHMTSVRDLGRPGTETAQAVAEIIGQRYKAVAPTAHVPRHRPQVSQ
jgi:arylformamidase